LLGGTDLTEKPRRTRLRILNPRSKGAHRRRKGRYFISDVKREYRGSSEGSRYCRKRKRDGPILRDSTTIGVFR